MRLTGRYAGCFRSVMLASLRPLLRAALSAVIACALPSAAAAQPAPAAPPVAPPPAPTFDPPPVVPPMTGLAPPPVSPPSSPRPAPPPLVAKPDYTYLPDYPNYGPAQPVVARRMYSPKLVMWGVVATSGGLLVLIAGSGLAASAVGAVDVYCEGPVLCGALDDKPKRTVGAIMMVVGGAATAVGIPLWIRGAQSVPDEKRGAFTPSLGLGPGKATLSVEF
jgi:hypothetical protein